ncbi:MAG: VanZ family protein [Clostridia bacterium]|nr:VanZ family protein [Clostridia bacterium]
MFAITFLMAELVFAGIWLLTRICVWVRQKRIDWKREALLLLMFVNLAVIIRFVFFPRELVDGHIQPLVFDPATAFPIRMNLVPLVHLLDYANVRDIVWNVAGNAAMFVPTGIVLPIVYKKLNNFWKVVGAGALISLCIELLQLPFPTRASDIDDIILNTLGVVVGYAVFALVRAIYRRGPGRQNTPSPTASKN